MNIIEAISGLLRKAERSDSPEEAETFFVKAQELMTKHRIDEAELNLNAEVRETPDSEVIVLPMPHAKAKQFLLHYIAQNNGCRAVGNARLNDNHSYSVHLYGFKSDRQAVVNLYNTLTIVMAREMIQARKENPWIHGRAFANSFIMGFSARIGARLEAARLYQESQQVKTTALVLRNRDNEVDRLVGKTSTSRRRASSNTGYHSGESAADRANLNASVSAPNRKALRV